LAGGSDIGGSIRIPASCCGVVGFKPPYGRVPQTAPFNLDHYCHDGPLARTVSDCLLFENAIAGPHPADIASIRPKVVIPDPDTMRRDLAGVRIAFSPDLGGFHVTSDVAKNAAEAAERFREAGATVEEVNFGWNRDDVIEAAWIHFAAIFGPVVAAIAEEHGDLLTDYAIDFAREAATHTGPGAYYRGLNVEAAVYSEVGALLERYDLLICPTIGLPALEAGKSFAGYPVIAEGVPQNLIDHLLTIVFNICSRCPVLSVPSGFSTDGVPTGISIVGRTYEDASVFEAGLAFERVQPWLDRPERRPPL
jgi:aspartyl-tRNA(Asn)/glutamyl-tRNA(Gln) amidotransferase subunit A